MTNKTRSSNTHPHTPVMHTWILDAHIYAQVVHPNIHIDGIYNCIHRYTGQVFSDISDTCELLFGEERVPALASSRQSLSATSHIFTVTAPPMPRAGRMPVALSCRDEDEIEGYIKYKMPPKLGSYTAIGGCTALQECTFVTRIASPTENIRLIDDLVFNFTGPEFVARAGTKDAALRVEIVSVNLDDLILLIGTPPAIAEASLIGTYMNICIYT
jgi:hypothetical protein